MGTLVIFQFQPRYAKLFRAWYTYHDRVWWRWRTDENQYVLASLSDFDWRNSTHLERLREQRWAALKRRVFIAIIDGEGLGA